MFSAYEYLRSIFIFQIIFDTPPRIALSNLAVLPDFHCKNAEDIHSKVLARRVYELKETQEGVDSMCREMDEIYNEGAKLGEERGRIQGIAEGLAAGEMKAKKETAL